MPINDELTLRLKIRQLNELLLDVRAYKEAHPEARCGYYTRNFGSLLNAYREGDLSFDECVRLMEEASTRAGAFADVAEWAEGEAAGYDGRVNEGEADALHLGGQRDAMLKVAKFARMLSAKDTTAQPAAPAELNGKGEGKVTTIFFASVAYDNHSYETRDFPRADDRERWIATHVRGDVYEGVKVVAVARAEGEWAAGGEPDPAAAPQ